MTARRDWTPEEDQRIRAFLGRNPTGNCQGLARDLGVAVRAVENRVNWLMRRPQTRGARLPCLRCRKEFRSCDRRAHRICEDCTRVVGDMARSAIA